MTRLEVGDVYKMEVAVISATGAYVTGLVIPYQLLDCADNSVKQSGNLSAIGNIYTASYTFSVAGQFRFEATPPAPYNAGFEPILVVTAKATAAELAKVRKTTDIIDANGTITAAELDVILLAKAQGLTTFVDNHDGTFTVVFNSPDGTKHRITGTRTAFERTAVSNDFS